MWKWIPFLVITATLGCHPESQQPSSAPTTVPLMKAPDNQPGGATTRALMTPVPVGMAHYAYTVMDDAGTSVIKGTLTLPDPLPSNGSFEGRWVASYFSNDEVAPTTHLGPQTGEGKLIAKASDGTIRLELNPGTADSNVEFQLQMDGSSFKGNWTYSTDAGVTSRGTISGHRE
jgi:hypothetical protein